MTDQTLFPVDIKLTERQQQVYALTEHGPLTAAQAGVALHLKHNRQCRCGPCTFVSSEARAESRRKQRERERGRVKAK